MTSALITLICRQCFSCSPTSPHACDRSSDRVRRQALGNLRVSSDGLRVANTRKAIAWLTPAELHHPPRFGWYTRLDFILSFFISHFSFLLVFGLKPRCRRDLNIAFMLHRVTRRCLLRKPSFFITWKFIARPLNRDEAEDLAATIGRVVIVMMSDSRYLHAYASRDSSAKIFFVRKRFWSSPRERGKKPVRNLRLTVIPRWTKCYSFGNWRVP